MTDLNDSEVQIELDGKTVTLKATLEACMVMSRAYGGMKPLHDRVTQLDLEAISLVVRCGMMVDGDEARIIPAKVYKTGVLNLMPQVSEYVLLCASGGVRIDDSDVESPGKP